MDELEARAHAQLNSMRGLQEQLGSIRVRETSPDDLVTVEVDASGALCDLGLAPGVGELGGRRLGELIVATAHAAARIAFARRAALLEDFNRSFGEMVGVAADGGPHAETASSGTA
ncbi:YbaB/EbfC family nucleoid-associated protein [Williamsia sterculiae]|uniref:YbaB/EbfC DNA-binding family protein n=1 Tax=Williamsia sterculiae TaxID=1344003 RepID=A0A1N7GSI9_9NOCA|nr:YbaB/EbfC family nucleoid-associated protein [Williamsia sterculiae]SIS15545.1 YbaB/EbfC DNA-binding family protein [Williamsia sterculiae]